MRTAIFFSTIIGLALSANAVAADQEQVEAAKQAAIEICLSKATERYGSAEMAGRVTKKRLNNRRGYNVRLKVGERSKKVNCFAAKNNDVTFYSGG
ncbi:MAG: hypothetical protein RJQ07_06585 [Pseudomonadales bacterium]